MILDNAKGHHAIPLQEFLKENKDRLEVVFLHPIGPGLILLKAYGDGRKMKLSITSFIVL